MKKILLILTTGLFFNFTSFAGSDGQNNKDTRAMEATRQLSSELQFNERTFILVKDLNVAKFQELDKVNTMYANNARLKEAKIKEIENQFNGQISALLTPTQKANFENYLNNTAHASIVEQK